MSDRLTLEIPDALVEAVADLVLERLAAVDGGRDSPWLSVGEAAEYLRVSGRQVQRLIARGRVRSTTIGRRRLLHRDDLDSAATGEETTRTAPPRRREE